MKKFFGAIAREIYAIYDEISFQSMRKRLDRNVELRRAQQQLTNIDHTPSTPPGVTKYSGAWSWYCGDCFRYNEIFVDKFVAIVDSERRKLNKLYCAFCGSTKREDERYASSSSPDEEVIEFWLKDDEAYFWSQDEDLMIALLPTAQIISLLRRCQVEHYNKGFSLIEALLVQFRDGSYQEKDGAMLVSWLRENRHIWDQEPFWGYLTEDVNRKLGEECTSQNTPDHQHAIPSFSIRTEKERPIGAKIKK